MGLGGKVGAMDALLEWVQGPFEGAGEGAGTGAGAGAGAGAGIGMRGGGLIPLPKSCGVMASAPGLASALEQVPAAGASFGFGESVRRRRSCLDGSEQEQGRA